MQKLDSRSFKEMPWKNGLGMTLEIYKEGEVFRLSQAKITQAGPFSFFPGKERKIIIIDGKGIILNGRRLEPLDVFSFSGDEAFYAELISGEVSDFNVMTDRSWGMSEVRVLRGKDVHHSSDKKTFLYVLSKEAPELWILEPFEEKTFSFAKETTIIATYLTVR